MTLDKILTLAELVAARADWKERGLRVVFTNGCYDLLHPGHVRFLESARALGDVLVVGLNSDASVRRLKGLTRPITPELERAEIMAALAAVDAVSLFAEDTPLEIIEALRPDILVKGEDWSHLVVGRDVVEKAGGEVVLLPLVEGLSTTSIVDRIRAAEASNSTGSP